MGRPRLRDCELRSISSWCATVLPAALPCSLAVTRGVVIITGHNINSSIIMRISTGIVMVSVTVDLG